MTPGLTFCPTPDLPSAPKNRTCVKRNSSEDTVTGSGETKKMDEVQMKKKKKENLIK